MFHTLARLIVRPLATACGAGYAPVAPGTAGSAVGVALYLAVSRCSWYVSVAVLLAVILTGVWASDQMARLTRNKDPQVAVIDEVAGQLVALSVAPVSLPWVAGGFVLFRLFDIFKPPPVRQLERLPGGWGVMADDLMAGLYSAAILLALRALVK